MQFTTVYFAVFFIIVFTVYWFVLRKSVQAQNSLLLVASYAFYAWWDWRFLGLIVFTSIVTFFTAKHANGSIGKYLSFCSVKFSLFVYRVNCAHNVGVQIIIIMILVYIDVGYHSLINKLFFYKII